MIEHEQMRMHGSVGIDSLGVRIEWRVVSEQAQGQSFDLYYGLAERINYKKVSAEFEVCPAAVKYDEVYVRDHADGMATRAGLALYFRFYNAERRHQSLENRTPETVYFDA